MVKINSKIDHRVNFYKIATKIYKDVDYPNVPIPVYAMFYVVMSQYFKNIKINFGGELRSLRFSFFHISSTRTGKGQLCKAAEMVAKELGISTATETDLTDAGLLGSIDEKAIDYNYKNKKEPGDEGYKDPIIYGDLFNYDIIFFKEVKKLLVPTSNTAMMLSIFQEALDEPGYIRKKLKCKFPIEGEVTSSIVATTYYMPEIEKTLLEQGFFMRVPLYCRTFTIDEIKGLRDGVVDLFRETSRKVVERDIKEYCKEIKEIKNSGYNLFLDDSAVGKLKDLNNHFYKLMKGTAGSKLEILKGLSQTVIDLSIKIGGIHACLEESKLITDKHMIPATIFVRSCVDTILNRIDITDTQASKEFDIYIRLFRKLETNTPEISKEGFIHELKLKGIGRNRAIKSIQKMIDKNYFKVVKGDRNTQLLKLNEGV